MYVETLIIDDKLKERVSKYIKLTGNYDVDVASIYALEALRKNIVKGISVDITKYSLPESYLVKLQTSFNGRSLQNFLELRSSKDALWEIQILARSIYDALPSEHKYLYSEYVTNIDNCSTNSIDATTAE